MNHIVVVDDEPGMREFLSILLSREGYAVTTAAGGPEALRVLAERPVDLVISDIKMPRMDGVALLERLREIDPNLPVIMVTAYASSDSAILAMKLGAYDYITKPFKVQEITLVVKNALEKRRFRVDEPAATPTEAVAGIIGRSPKMVGVYKLISRVAAVDSTVLITGESGTGKELVARTIHYNSRRGQRRFLAINCGALAEPLLESELFGHVKGAFTGAVAHKAGLFEAAQGGTVFLDEIDAMSPGLQVKLLRVVQERMVRRVGTTDDIEADVRVIGATNKNLPELVKAGGFREDLYYRLNVIPLSVPPLRERPEDIPLLVNHFLAQYCARAGRPPLHVSTGAMAILEAYPWPGNVRELENVIERAVALETTDALTPASLPEEVRNGRRAEPLPRFPLPPEGVDLEAMVAGVERDLMAEALARAGGVQTRAAELLRMTFRAFRYKAKKYGLDRRKSVRPEP